MNKNKPDDIDPYIKKPMLVETLRGNTAQKAAPMKQVKGVSTMDWNSLVNLAATKAEESGVPVSVILSQMASESGRGTSKIFKEKNNLFGYNAIDDAPGKKSTAFNSPEESIDAYIGLLQSPRYANAWASRQDPALMLKEIENAGYAGDPKTWKSRAEKMMGKKIPYNSYSEMMMDSPEWRNNQNNY